MSYTTTMRLLLQKAVPGSNQPFETTVFNNNLDKIDADTVATVARVAAVETTIISGNVNSASTAALATTATTATKASKITASGLDRTVFVSSSAPVSGMVSGDIWIKA
jgi:hypothetical protein